MAPNGAYKQAADHPAVPLTAEALGREARACLDAGAAMMHMHVRRPDGRHLLDAQAYRDALAAVRKAVGDELLVQVTSEAAGVYRAAEQMAMVRELAPEAVSVGLREIAVPEIPESELAAFLAWLAERRVLTQIILYDEADVRRWQALRQRGLVPAGAWSVLFVLGRWRGTDLVRPGPAALPGRQRPCAALGRLRLRTGRKRLRHDRGGLRRPHARGLREQPEAARRRHRAGQRRAGAAGGRKARARWAARWPTRPTRAGSTAPSPERTTRSSRQRHQDPTASARARNCTMRCNSSSSAPRKAAPLGAAPAT